MKRPIRVSPWPGGWSTYEGPLLVCRPCAGHLFRGPDVYPARPGSCNAFSSLSLLCLPLAMWQVTYLKCEMSPFSSCRGWTDGSTYEGPNLVCCPCAGHLLRGPDACPARPGSWEAIFFLRLHLTAADDEAGGPFETCSLAVPDSSPLQLEVSEIRVTLFFVTRRPLLRPPAVNVAVRRRRPLPRSRVPDRAVVV